MRVQEAEMRIEQEEQGIELTIPRICDDPMKITLMPSGLLFVIGTNGSGKSALIQHFVSTTHKGNFRRLSAHRQTWFQSELIDLTPRTRQEYGHHITQWEIQNGARWRDEFSQQKQEAVLFDLVASENLSARNTRHFVQEGNLEEARKVGSKDATPIAKVNKLLEQGNLHVVLELTEEEEILVRNRCGGEPYSLAQMSHGERNAAILAATVVTARSDTLFLIDEPERHLHRAIIEPFLVALFQQRNDCIYIISTHEIALPVSSPDANVLIVRSCKWNGEEASAWDVDLIEEDSVLPEDLRRAVLGSRKRILFVEGDDSRSLDSQLYRALYPSISVLPKGSCAEVMKAVRGLRGSESLHHVEAFGLIDRDNRPPDEVKKLEDEYVFALDVHSVEALYFCSDSISAVAQHQAESLMKDPKELTMAAKESALDALGEGGLAERMAAKWCERHVRNSMMTETPDWKTIGSSPTATICASVPSPFPRELKRFQDLLASKKLEDLVARYPLRESRVFDAIARALHLTGKETFEQTLLSKLQGNENLVHGLRQRIQSLTDALGM